MQTKIQTLTQTSYEVRWYAIAILISLMITIGAIKAEAAHAFVVDNHDHGETTFAREREVRHSEPQLGDGFRPHSFSGSGF
ncbi:MAG: hypothetical protein WBP26_03885 [Candidatus Saccharimonadales bacterium]